MTKRIRISGYEDFTCPLNEDRTIADVKQEICFLYRLSGGYIVNHGAATHFTDFIVGDGDYAFVNFQSAPTTDSQAVQGPIEESPFTNFLRYLPEDRKPIDAETVGIIERCFGNWLSGIFSVEGAVSLLEAASDHVHRSTAYRIRSVHGLLLNGSLEQDDSVDADLVRAFDIHTLAPKIIKFSDTAHIDHQIFLKLGLTADEAIERYIVPARLITDVGGKQAIVMPAYANSLSVVRSNNQEKDDAIVLMPAILRGVVQIRTALLTLHSAGIIHNDIKPGNILLDFSGNWHLCDLGSCTCTGIRLEKDAKFSEYYAPSDFHNLSAKVRRNTRAYDHLLLAVVALDRLELLDLRNRFTSNQLIDSVSKVTHVELAALLRELIACLL